MDNEELDYSMVSEVSASHESLHLKIRQIIKHLKTNESIPSYDRDVYISKLYEVLDFGAENGLC